MMNDPKYNPGHYHPGQHYPDQPHAGQPATGPTGERLSSIERAVRAFDRQEFVPPSAPGERFKVTAYILGRQLRTDGVRLSAFRQVQQGGQWVDAPISTATTSELEDKVLARARELRSQATATN